MKFKKYFIYSLIFLNFGMFIVNAHKWPKSRLQMNHDVTSAKHKIMCLTKHNLKLSKKICKKILLDQNKLHEKYDDFFGPVPIYNNIDFIREAILWSENYDNMGFPGFSELVEALYKHNINDITEANTYIYSIYRELSLIL